MSARPSDETPGRIGAELRFMGAAFFRPFLWTLLLVGLAYALVVLFGASDPGAPSKVVLVPVAFVYGLFVGFWPAVAVGSLRLSWKLVGGWTLLPVILLPVAAGLALWAAAGMLEEQANAIWDAARLPRVDARAFSRLPEPIAGARSRAGCQRV